MPEKNLDTTTLENWLWDAACQIRGPVDAPKYKDYILPLIFIKRLSDVFEKAVVLLEEAEEERAKADAELKKVLGELGF